jgi:tetratricopeptide (TPR) repeat protein
LDTRGRATGARRLVSTIKVLFLAANPDTTSRVALDEEIRAIDARIRGAGYGDQVVLVSHWAVRLDDLSGLLMRHRPHIVHFSGHGSADGSLVLHPGDVAKRDLEGYAQAPAAVAAAPGHGRLPVDGLARLLEILRDNVRVVVLNACYSKAHAKGIVRSVECVVGTSRPIRDDHAIAFAAEFYQAVAYGRSVKDAFELGVIRLQNEGNDQADVLLGLETRAGVDAASIVLVRDPGRSGTAVAPQATQEQRAGRIWSVPHPRNLAFTGREAELTRLRQQLAAEGRAVLSGLGGIGKTQTAVEYAWRHRGDYTAVIWLNAETSLTLKTECGALVRRMKLPAPAEDLDLAVRVFLDWLASRSGWLLILDNADDPEQLASFPFEAGQGHVLVTSRSDDFQSFGVLGTLGLQAMTVEEATAFLLRRCGREKADAPEQASARQLAAVLGGLPLALEQAAAYIVASKATFADYLADYRKQGLKRLEASRPALGKYPRSVVSTWKANFDAVQAESPAAADVLQLSAFLAPSVIPFELLVQGSKQLGPAIQAALQGAEESPLLVHDLLRPLARFSLIRIEGDNRSFSIHGMVQEVLRAAMDGPTRRLWAERAVRALGLSFPDVEFDNWPLCDRLLPHARAVIPWIEKERIQLTEAAQLLNQTSQYLYNRAQYAEAEPLYQKASELWRAVLGKHDPDFARSLNNLAVLYRDTGRHSEAAPLFQEAIEICRTALGERHPNYAASLDNLAGLYRDTGRYAEAEPLIQEAIEIRRITLGEANPDYATSLNNLAGLYWKMGRYEQVEPLLRQASEIWRAALGKHDPDYAYSLHNLAVLYRDTGRHSEAAPLFLEATTILRAALGREHPTYQMVLKNYVRNQQDGDLPLREGDFQYDLLEFVPPQPLDDEGRSEARQPEPEDR